MQSSEPVARRQPPPRDLAGVLVVLVVALIAGWLLVVWAVVKRPILSVPIAVYVGLVVWLGPHDESSPGMWCRSSRLISSVKALGAHAAASSVTSLSLRLGERVLSARVS